MQTIASQTQNHLVANSNKSNAIANIVNMLYVKFNCQLPQIASELNAMPICRSTIPMTETIKSEINRTFYNIFLKPYPTATHHNQAYDGYCSPSQLLTQSI